MNSFIKSCVFIFTCLNFSPLQSTLHLMQSLYLDILYLLVLLPFLFKLFHTGKRFPLRIFFHSSRETKSSPLGQIGWMRRVGYVGVGTIMFAPLFLVRNCWTLSEVWAGSLGKLSIMKWANALKECWKKIPWSWSQPLTTPAHTLKEMGS